MATLEEEEEEEKPDSTPHNWRAEPEGVAAAPDSAQAARQDSAAQPLSPKAYALIALVGGVLGIGLLFFYVFQVPRLAASGVQNQVFYLLLIPWGLSCAAFLFGVMHSYARYRSTGLPHGLELGGPVVIFALVLIGGFRLVPPSAETFDLTVRAHSADGSDPIIEEGEVVIFFGASQQRQPFGQDGQAHFQEISQRFWQDSVTVVPRVEGYEQTPRKKILTSRVLELTLEPIQPIHEPSEPTAMGTVAIRLEWDLSMIPDGAWRVGAVSGSGTQLKSALRERLTSTSIDIELRGGAGSFRATVDSNTGASIPSVATGRYTVEVTDAQMECHSVPLLVRSDRPNQASVRCLPPAHICVTGAGVTPGPMELGNICTRSVRISHRGTTYTLRYAESVVIQKDRDESYLVSWYE